MAAGAVKAVKASKAAGEEHMAMAVAREVVASKAAGEELAGRWRCETW